MMLNKIRNLMLDASSNEGYKKVAGSFFMHIAIDSGDLELVERILQTSNEIECLNEEGYSPLHLAAFNGDIDMIKLLFNYGASPNIACINTYETPLHFVAHHGDVNLFKIFINHGADVNLEDRNRITSLEQLLKSNYENVFIEVLEYIDKNKLHNKTIMNCYQRAVRCDFEKAKQMLKEMLLV